MRASAALIFFQHNVSRSCRICSFLGQLAMVLSYLCITGVFTQDEKIKCTTSSVKPLQKAVLMCHFPEDISVTRKDFSVYHYVDDSSPNAVIDCWWLSNKLNCYSQPGYKYSKLDGTNLTVTVSKVTSELTGTYACQVAGYGRSSLETCDMKFELESDNTCNIIHNRHESQANITCFFNEDVAKKRSRFAVYQHIGQGKHIVANCSWEDTQPRCKVEDGYLHNDKISSYITLTLLNVTKDKFGNYSCWHDGFLTDQHKSCQLYVNDNDKPVYTDHTYTKLGIALVLMVLAILLAAGIILLLRFKRRNPNFCHLPRQRNVKSNGEERQPINAEDASRDEVDIVELTKEFEEYLVNNVKKMYGDLSRSCHFVPPVYFNKTGCETQTVGDQVVYIPVSSDTSDFRHDQAMQHVLHCLHQVAKQENERMFVLTQFQYSDYLNNPSSKYEKHMLPMPLGPEEGNKNVGCFDFLILHPDYGMLVGVVKAVSDKNVDDQNKVISEVTEAVQQLQNADQMIAHLLKDHQQSHKVRHTLLLPNLTRTSLQRAVNSHNELVESLRRVLDVKALEDPTKLCLCSEDLPNPKTGLDVSSAVVNNIRECWKWTLIKCVGDRSITNELYLSLIARFCGPATQSSFDVGEESWMLPKTLSEAVSVTGDLYERLTLYPDMIKLLREQRLFLVGPSNTGKTKMMTLAGLTWLSNCHNVCVLFDKSLQSEEAMGMFNKKFKITPGTRDTDVSSYGFIKEVYCKLNKKEEVKAEIDELMKMKTEKTLYIIADKSCVIRKEFKMFCETLREECPDLYLWATSSTAKDVPNGWMIQTFTQALNCPPVVVRKATRVGENSCKPGFESKTLPPTDGPPVKYFYHVNKPLGYKHNCKDCCREVADFLIKNLITTRVEVESPNGDSLATSTYITPGQKNKASLKKSSSLQNRDVLVLFECSIEKMQQFLTGLRECGIGAPIVQSVGNKYIYTEENDSVCAMHVDELFKYQPRKKIVIYVEHHTTPGDAAKRWRGFTSCSSQLIIIQRQL